MKNEDLLMDARVTTGGRIRVAVSVSIARIGAAVLVSEGRQVKFVRGGLALPHLVVGAISGAKTVAKLSVSRRVRRPVTVGVNGRQVNATRSRGVAFFFKCVPVSAFAVFVCDIMVREERASPAISISNASSVRYAITVGVYRYELSLGDSTGV